MSLIPIYRSLPAADDSLSFFRQLKRISELHWETVELTEHTYGYQIQQGSRWKNGLNDDDLKKFEKTMGFAFPESLANFYKVMNGLDRPGIDISDNTSLFCPLFYSFPDDLDLIEENINWIYESNTVNQMQIMKTGISRIFPVFAHRFILIDQPKNPILSMYGNDIIYWADNISKLLIKDIFWKIIKPNEDKKLQQLKGSIKFWLDE
jgi:hypothetical protein